MLSLNHNVSRTRSQHTPKRVGGLNFIFALTKKPFSERFEDNEEDNTNLADVLVVESYFQQKVISRSFPTTSIFGVTTP